MTTKKCNWKTDLQLAETFYTLAENNTLVATPIPDDAIDFQIVYRAEHDCRYTVSRTRGVYNGCKKIDANTLAVFIPLSRYSLGRGPLLRELYMQVPNNDFEGKIRNICVPADTKHFLWDGPTDNDVVVATEIITATILKGNTGDSAYEDAVQHGYEGTEEQYALWPIIQGDYAKEQAGIAKGAAAKATDAAEKANTAAGRVETAITNATTATAEAEKTTKESKTQTDKAKEATDLANKATGAASDATAEAKKATSATNLAATNANQAATRAEKVVEELHDAEEVTQAAIKATEEALAATQTMQEMQPQITKAASLVPALLRVEYPGHITTRNPRTHRVNARLLPASSLQNIIFQVEAGNSVFVRPDGEIIRRGIGTTRINVLPTANIPLYQVLDITVEQPRIRQTGAGKIRRTAAGKIRLT